MRQQRQAQGERVVNLLVKYMMLAESPSLSFMEQDGRDLRKVMVILTEWLLQVMCRITQALVVLNLC